VNARSDHVRVVRNTAADAVTVYPVAKASLTAGDDGAAVTTANMVAAAGELDDKDEYAFSMLVDTFMTVGFQKELDRIAAARQDAIALLSVPEISHDTDDAIRFRVVDLNLNSNRSALFHNDSELVDPYNGGTVFIPAAAMAAARIAASDRVANAAYSPAGFRRGLANTSLRLRRKLKPTDRDRLAASQVNYFASDAAWGIALRESYTLQSAYSALSFIPVRRTLDIAEQSVERALRPFLQEPNDGDITRVQMVSLVEDIYRLMRAARMIRRFRVIDATRDVDVGAGNVRIFSILEPLLPAVRIEHTTFITRQGEAAFSAAVESVAG